MVVQVLQIDLLVVLGRSDLSQVELNLVVVAEINEKSLHTLILQDGGKELVSLRELLEEVLSELGARNRVQVVEPDVGETFRKEHLSLTDE